MKRRLLADYQNLTDNKLSSLLFTQKDLLPRKAVDEFVKGGNYELEEEYSKRETVARRQGVFFVKYRHWCYNVYTNLIGESL